MQLRIPLGMRNPAAERLHFRQLHVEQGALGQHTLRVVHHGVRRARLGVT